MKAKFGGEIGDFWSRCTEFSVGIGSRHIGFELLKDRLHFPDVIVVVREFDQTSLARKLQHPDRIMVRSIPELRVQMPKEPPCIRLPGPPQIVSKFPERF